MYIALAIAFVFITVCVMIASSFVRTWAVNVKPDAKTEKEKEELSKEIERLKAVMIDKANKNADNNATITESQNDCEDNVVNEQTCEIEEKK